MGANHDNMQSPSQSSSQSSDSEMYSILCILACLGGMMLVNDAYYFPGFCGCEPS